MSPARSALLALLPRSGAARGLGAKGPWGSLGARARGHASAPPFGDAAAAEAASAAEPRLPSEEELRAFGKRLQDGGQRAFRVPFLVADALLPRQRLRFASGDGRLERLAASGEVGVFGVSPFTGLPLQRGVTASLARLPGERWEFCGRRHVRMLGREQSASEEEVEEALVEALFDDVQAADIEAAKGLLPLVDEWLKLVEHSKFERFDGQIRGILADLGPMPPAEAAGDLALWVAALVNPLPALGVAYEIRPSALEARSVGERVQVVRDGIEGSIGHVSGKYPLF